MRSVQTILISTFSKKKLKPTKICLETVNCFVSVSMVKLCHNPNHLPNYTSQRWSRSVQTTLLPILFQKRVKPTNICVEVVNSFVSISMIKMCHNSKHLTNYMSQKRIKSVQTTLIPIFFQKRLKPTNICVEAVNCFVNISMVKMCHYPMHLTNHKSQRWSMSIQTTFIPIFS